MSSDFLNLLIAVKPKEIYVVLLKNDQGKLDLLADPGLGKPWSSKNKRLADFHAKQNNGEARTCAEAWDILLKANPLFEKDLFDRILNKNQNPPTSKRDVRRN